MLTAQEHTLKLTEKLGKEKSAHLVSFFASTFQYSLATISFTSSSYPNIRHFNHSGPILREISPEPLQRTKQPFTREAPEKTEKEFSRPQSLRKLEKASRTGRKPPPTPKEQILKKTTSLENVSLA